MISSKRRGFSKRSKLVHSKKSARLNIVIMLQKLTKVAMAKRMNTSRSQLDRLLDPANGSVSLETLTRAALAVGRQIRLELV